MTTQFLQQARPFLNLAALARAAGIPEQTLFAKVRRGTALSENEATRLTAALESAGLSASSAVGRTPGPTGGALRVGADE